MRLVRGGVSAGLAWDTSNPNGRLTLLDYLLDPGETREGSNPSPRTNLKEFAHDNAYQVPYDL
jgi:hypothetical protein